MSPVDSEGGATTDAIKISNNEPLEKVQNAYAVKLTVPKPTNESDAYPEGGAKAWLAVSGASACLFVSFGWVNVAGFFQEYYITHQLSQHTPSEVAWIPSLQGEFE